MRSREAVRESGAGTTDAAGLAPPSDDSGRPVLACGLSGRWTRTLQVLADERIPFTESPQSPSRMTPATTALDEAVVKHQVTYDGDKRLARHVSNAVLKADSRGTRLSKEHKDSRRRIDLAAAAVMAHDRARALASGPRAAIYVLG
jgi:hypothetical protein